MFQWVTRKLFGRRGNAEMPHHKHHRRQDQLDGVLGVVNTVGNGHRRGCTKPPLAIVKKRNRRRGEIARMSRVANRA